MDLSNQIVNDVVECLVQDVARLNSDVLATLVHKPWG